MGAVSFGSLDKADFVFYALMEQHILQYVEDQIAIQFNAAKTASHAGFLKAQNDLSSAQITVNQRIVSGLVPTSVSFSWCAVERRAEDSRRRTEGLGDQTRPGHEGRQQCHSQLQRTDYRSLAESSNCADAI